MLKRTCLILFLFLVTTSVDAKKKANLTVLFGMSRPPFIMEDTKTGISINLFRKLSEKLGYSFKHVFSPNRRMNVELKNGSMDVVVEVQKGIVGAYYSDPFIGYRNFAVSRKKDQVKVESYTDLKGRSICAWQDAKNDLGNEFKKATQVFSKYQEFPIQKDQVKSWLSGACQVIIIDETILKWWIKELSPEYVKRNRKLDLDLSYDVLPGQEILWWFMGFKDRELRDQFNKVLKEFKANGIYDKIRADY